MPERGSKRQRCQSSEQVLEFFRCDPNDLFHDWWPRTKRVYTTAIWRQRNNQRSGCIAAHPAPQKFRVHKPAGKVLASIFWDQNGILVINYLQKGQTVNAGYYSSLLVQLKDIWRTTAAESSPRGSCSCTKLLRLTGHLQTRRNWPTWASSVLITHPILRIWPHRTTICSLDWKTNERSQFFVRRGVHCCRGDLVGRTTFWFFFLSGNAKVRATG